MDLCQIAPGHKRLNSSPPAKENVPSEYLPTEAELGFFPPETNLFQSASNNWPLQVLVLLGEAWTYQEQWLRLVFASPANLPFSKFTQIY